MLPVEFLCVLDTYTGSKSRPVPRSALGKGVPSSELTHPSHPTCHALPLPQTLWFSVTLCHLMAGLRAAPWNQRSDLLLAVFAFSRLMPWHWGGGHCVPSVPVSHHLLFKYCILLEVFYALAVSSPHEPVPAFTQHLLGNHSSCQPSPTGPCPVF